MSLLHVWREIFTSAPGGDVTHLYVWHDFFPCICGVIHLYVWRDLFIRTTGEGVVTWLLYRYGVRCLYVWHGTFTRTAGKRMATWLIYFCIVTHLNVGHDWFTRSLGEQVVTWLCYRCGMTCLHAWHGICVICGMTHWHMWPDSFTRSPGEGVAMWLLYMIIVTHFISLFFKCVCYMTHVHVRQARMQCLMRCHVWHDSFTCATWLIHMYNRRGGGNMTPVCEYRDSSACVTWLIYTYDRRGGSIWRGMCAVWFERGRVSFEPRFATGVFCVCVVWLIHVWNRCLWHDLFLLAYTPECCLNFHTE